jgi:carbamoyltransferase
MGAMLLAFFQKFASGSDTISYTGGVAQNVVWNSTLREAFPNLVIAPHASDEGLSLGALEWLRRQHEMAPFAWPSFPWAQSDAGAAAPGKATIARAAQMLADGKIVGWYQGFGEIGPRALGNRSILMDPRLANGKERINGVKKREQYRPFGASVLAECFDDYFAGAADGFMLYACQLRSGSFPAITHVDGSCRVQLVNDDNPVFRQLLAAFFALTGCPVLLNTSLNLAGKPIAALPEHAMTLFNTSPLDAMVVGDQFLQR